MNEKELKQFKALQELKVLLWFLSMRDGGPKLDGRGRDD